MQIAILGCGWLGLPLAEKLTENHVVRGSVTSPEKLQVLSAAGILPYIIDLNAPQANSITGFLSGSDVLVIAIPPKVEESNTMTYQDKVQALLPYIEAAGIKNVLFTSSVSVYGEDETFPEVDETTPTHPITESGKQVLAAEQVLQNCNSFKTTIIRFGGLVGGERHPVKHLSGKQNLQNPNAPVNLISRSQCLDIILQLINKGVWGEVFTASVPQPLNRQEFYTKEAKTLGLPLLHFATDGISAGKKVKGQQKIMQLLGYKLQ